MKALFKSHFPFVEGSEEELTKEQKLIKQTYDKLYNSNNVPADTDSKEKIRQDKKAKAKSGELREIRSNDSGTRGRS